MKASYTRLVLSVACCVLMMAILAWKLLGTRKPPSNVDEASIAGWGARDPETSSRAWTVNPNSRIPTDVQEKWRECDLLFYQSSPWSASEVDTLIRYMSTPVRRVDFDDDVTVDDNAATSTVQWAIMSFQDRYVRGLDIDPAAGVSIKNKIRDLLDSPSDLVRMNAIGAANWTGMLMDPQVLEKVQKMRHDPKPLVAGLARRVVKDMALPQLQASWARSKAHMGF